MLRASLPWYDLKEIRSSTDAFWSQLATNLRESGFQNVPENLNRTVPYQQQWESDAFLFGQACGYDVVIAYPDHLQLVATPCYRAAGCSGSSYSSYVVVRDDAPFQTLEDLRGSRCVINTLTSHSGMNILRALVAPLHAEGRFFSEVTISGSHQDSVSLIKRNEVDVAAIDCVTYAHLIRHRPAELAGTRILAQSKPVPAPPFVTSKSLTEKEVIRLRQALIATLESPEMIPIADELLLNGIEILPLDEYHSIADLRQVAQKHGYKEIPES